MGDSSSDEDQASGERATGIRFPTTNDVLCGRGGHAAGHAGNIKFRMLVETHKHRYSEATRYLKSQVAAEIVRIWKAQDPPGRFLALDENDNTLWCEVDEKVALQKASQSLRERAPKVDFAAIPRPEVSQPAYPPQSFGAMQPQQVFYPMAMAMPMMSGATWPSQSAYPFAPPMPSVSSSMPPPPKQESTEQKPSQTQQLDTPVEQRIREAEQQVQQAQFQVQQQALQIQGQMILHQLLYNLAQQQQLNQHQQQQSGQVVAATNQQQQQTPQVVAQQQQPQPVAMPDQFQQQLQQLSTQQQQYLQALMVQSLLQPANLLQAQQQQQQQESSQAQQEQITATTPQLPTSATPQGQQKQPRPQEGSMQPPQQIQKPEPNAMQPPQAELSTANLRQQQLELQNARTPSRTVSGSEAGRSLAVSSLTASSMAKEASTSTTSRQEASSASSESSDVEELNSRRSRDAEVPMSVSGITKMFQQGFSSSSSDDDQNQSKGSSENEQQYLDESKGSKMFQGSIHSFSDTMMGSTEECGNGDGSSSPSSDERRTSSGKQSQSDTSSTGRTSNLLQGSIESFSETGSDKSSGGSTGSRGGKKNRIGGGDFAEPRKHSRGSQVQRGEEGDTSSDKITTSSGSDSGGESNSGGSSGGDGDRSSSSTSANWDQDHRKHRRVSRPQAKKLHEDT